LIREYNQNIDLNLTIIKGPVIVLSVYHSSAAEDGLFDLENQPQFLIVSSENTGSFISR